MSHCRQCKKYDERHNKDCKNRPAPPTEYDISAVTTAITTAFRQRREAKGDLDAATKALAKATDVHLRAVKDLDLLKEGFTRLLSGDAYIRFDEKAFKREWRVWWHVERVALSVDPETDEEREHKDWQKVEVTFAPESKNEGKHDPMHASNVGSSNQGKVSTHR